MYVFVSTIYIFLKVLESLDYFTTDILFAYEKFYLGITGRAVNMRVGLALRNT